MDVLSDVLRGVRLTGAVFLELEAHSPWVGSTPISEIVGGLVMPEAEHVISLHVLTAGSCWAELGDDSSLPIQLSAGDVVIIPKGHAHFLSSSPGMRGEPDLAVYHRPNGRSLPLPYVLNQTAGGDESCHFVCGFLGCDRRPFNPLLDALPSLFHARASNASRSWLSTLLDAAVDKTEEDSVGRETMLAKLAELLFVEVLRKHIGELPENSRGWLSGLRDPKIGRSLRLMHEQPTEDWTIERLAREVGLSRSAFAERFVQYVGFPPMNYLAQWRMQLASRALERPGISVAQAAASVGYESEAAFRRAFERYVGVSPAAWRRHGVAVGHSEDP